MYFAAYLPTGVLPHDYRAADGSRFNTFRASEGLRLAGFASVRLSGAMETVIGQERRRKGQGKVNMRTEGRI
jgi:hypothetical protein